PALRSRWPERPLGSAPGVEFPDGDDGAMSSAHDQSFGQRARNVNGVREMAVIDVKVFYVEMRAHFQRVVPPPRPRLAVIEAKKPTIAYYRFLYHTVGSRYHWLSRAKLSDAGLAAVIGDPANEVHVLFADGVPAGFVEFDRRVPNEVEITQFGLMPEFIGQGLGKWFLQWAVDRAWSYGIRRLWLHTCTLDHPNALSNYHKGGFKLYKEEVKRREVPV